MGIRPNAARPDGVPREGPRLDYLPSGALQFLMELSIDPVAEQLGVC